MDQHHHDEFSDINTSDEAPPQTLRAKPDSLMDPAGEAGWFLERERLSRNLSREDVAAVTGIHPYHVEAIEYGDMTHMPPRLEALEMIAAYASLLGFDPDPLLQHYASFLPRPQVAPRHHPANPLPMMSAKILPFGKFPKIPSLDLRNIKLPPMPTIPGGRNGIVASVAACALLFAGLSWMMGGSPAPAPGTMDVASQQDAAPDTMPTATTGPDAAQIKVTESPIAATDGVADGLPVDGLEGDESAIADQNPSATPGNDELGAFIAQQVGDADPQTVAATSKPADAATGPNHVYGSTDDAVRVVLKARKPIWLLIDDAQGNRVATQLLNAGDSYRVPNRDGLVAIAQDGGALSYELDGEEKGLLGQPGTLLPAEPLDPKALAKKG